MQSAKAFGSESGKTMSTKAGKAIIRKSASTVTKDASLETKKRKAGDTPESERLKKRSTAQQVMPADTQPSQDDGKETADEKRDTTFIDRKLDKYGNIGRSDQEKSNCLRRDNNHCIITHLQCPHVCHIVPFAWNKNITNLRTCNTLCSSLRIFDVEDSTTNLLGSSLGATDKAWNMLSLTPALHDFWSRAFFGLKRLGFNPSMKNGRTMATVKIQFVWLPRMAYKTFLNKVELQDQDPFNESSLISKLRNHTVPSDLYMVNTQSKVSIQTGQTFEVCLELSDALNLIRMLDIQWALIRLAAMSGAADAFDQGFFTGPDTSQRTMAWLNDLDELADQGEAFENLEEP